MEKNVGLGRTLCAQVRKKDTRAKIVEIVDLVQRDATGEIRFRLDGHKDRIRLMRSIEARKVV